MKNINLQYLQDKTKNLSSGPGCYLMKRSVSNGSEEVLYVGKAKNLKKRVKSYFMTGNKALSAKTIILVSHIEDFDFILTGNETEAFILENNLIKKFRPKYNIRLKDDKSYPYLVVDYNTPYPRLRYLRKIKKAKGVLVFGPFTESGFLSKILKILTKSFGLRDCSLSEFHKRKTPCLLYQMKQCLAPCVGLVSEDQYQEHLKMALSFFKGNGASGLACLEKIMFEYAEKEEFEAAAILRDQITYLKQFLLLSTQKNIEINSTQNIDIISAYEGEKDIDLSIYILRNGMLLGHKNYFFNKLDRLNQTVSECILAYLMQHYSAYAESLPQKIITPFSVAENSLLQDGLGQKFGDKFQVQPAGIKFRSLLKLTHTHAIEQHNIRSKKSHEAMTGLIALKELLQLKQVPVWLECYDIAIWQGEAPAASQVVFKNGTADKKSYRYYHLAPRPEGNNDFAMVEEVIERRIDNGNLPDVFIIDGGLGQVRSALKILNKYQINIPVIGIAKAKVKKSASSFKNKNISKTSERLILPGAKVSFELTKSPSLMRLIVKMRDESHRFSRKLHHNKLKKRIFHSWLDDVPGIGPKWKIKILKKIDRPIHELAQMDSQQIATYLAVPKKLAENILKKLQA